MGGVLQAFVWILGRSRVALSAVGLLAAGACTPATPILPALRLVDLRPRERSSVYLNEPLVLHFSAELDRASITAQSVRIATRSGRPARGTRFVVGRELTFVPEPVRAADLLDGGYVPNTTYLVELAGFPRADALRSEAGSCLATTLRIEFHTVSVESRGTGSLFIDDSPDRAMPLFIGPRHGGKLQSTVKMLRHSGLELEGEEPIDPSTVSDDDFALVPYGGPAGLAEIPLRAVLEDNYNKRAFHRQGTTTLRLVPRSLVPPGDYRLRVKDLHLRDFSGHQIPVIGKDGLKQLNVKVLEAPRGDLDGERFDEYLEEFLDTKMRSSAVVPGADGTALWSSSGRVEIRYPAAAGDGSNGAVIFGAREVAANIAATRFTLPQEVETLWEPGGGVAVLASQGVLEVSGRLERTGDAHPAVFPEVRAGDTLTAWLERHRNSGLPLTILVAGADLRISGEIDVPGPLLLVSGGRTQLTGRIRIAGADPVGSNALLRTGRGTGIDLGECGAIFFWSVIEGDQNVVTYVEDAKLTLDPPRINPLVNDLTYAVRSQPVPQDGRVARWLPSEGPLGRAGAGTLRVRFAGERRFDDAAGNYEVEVDDPALLVDCPTLRLVLELKLLVAKGAPWDPPSIDTVRVRWETR